MKESNSTIAILVISKRLAIKVGFTCRVHKPAVRKISTRKTIKTMADDYGVPSFDSKVRKQSQSDVSSVEFSSPKRKIV